MNSRLHITDDALLIKGIIGTVARTCTKGDRATALTSIEVATDKNMVKTQNHLFLLLIGVEIWWTDVTSEDSTEKKIHEIQMSAAHEAVRRSES